MEKKYFFIFSILSIILSLSSCKKNGMITSDEEDQEVAEARITESRNEVVARGEIFVIAINNGDSLAAANCYTRDAKIMRPNSKPIVGRTNILKAFSQRLNQGKLRFSMKTVSVFGDGITTLTAEEEWMLSDEQGKIIDEGKSLEVYKKEDGKWKMFRDCFNSNLPCFTTK